MKVAIVGGGAAGFFSAINIKEFLAQAEVIIFEKSNKVLSKVLMSGGGRCNCTNSFEDVKNIKDVYPRGSNIINRLFKTFSWQDTCVWFENHGVKFVEEDNGRMFPESQSSKTIVDSFLFYAKKYNIKIRTGTNIDSIEQLKDFDFIVLTVGGYSNDVLLQDLKDRGHKIAKPLPSLFAFVLKEEGLRNLSGISVPNAELLLAGTKYKAKGDVLVTHFGLSGPAILRLSSYAASYLNEKNYKHSLLVNWVGENYLKTEGKIEEVLAQYPQKLISNVNPFALPNSLWVYLLEKTLGERAKNKISSLNRKDINRLLNTLCSDNYNISKRYAHKEEFVTCGGVDFESLNPLSLQSKHINNLYFAGEVLNIDGITGGFNLQSAWTTAFVVAKSISSSLSF